MKLTPQTSAIYRILLQSDAFTAKEIAEKLNIFPHAVYRVMQELIKGGCVEMVASYPQRFRALPVEKSVESYIFLHRKNFLNAFVLQQTKQLNHQSSIEVSFIQQKSELFTLLIKDQQQAQQTIDLIVSGLEAPAEVILEKKRALERGVTMRILVQRDGITTRAMLKNWQRLGIQVRTILSIDARLLLIDDSIAYLISYDPSNTGKAVGVRISYGPIALFLKEIFEQRWTIGRIV